ncbi:flagellar basal body-associated FliL family protein [Fundidesulfovibrio putealis]|uniref:flagellar basal body-associated FliL family protein n=1 Tax=Fundidesulfovibrio putealis TaxID=270496 RepID=UPI0004235891|nr:flagellar basal body-associated FliL family protein [Fundidesulfovibrio putealis]
MAKIEEEDDGAAPKKKKSKLLLIIILVVLLAALGGGGYFAYLKFLAPPPPETAEAAPAEGEKKDEKKKEEKKDEKKDEKKKEEGASHGKKDDKGAKPVTTIQNIVTNLADPGGKRYVRLSVEFDFKDEHVAQEFGEKYQARIKDTILTLLWSKTSEELSSVDGMIAFRTELQSRVNQIMGPGAVKQVFITDRVIQ